MGEGGDDLDYPQPLVLNKAMAMAKDILCPNTTIFSWKEAADKSWPMFQASQVATNTAQLLQLAPIPAFLVYDGLEWDIPAPMIIKRILNSAEAGLAMMKHSAAFLWASMIKFQKSDITVEVNPAAVMTYP
eukprot:6173097-Ditylum_brightwellii.AAC.1